MQSNVAVNEQMHKLSYATLNDDCNKENGPSFLLQKGKKDAVNFDTEFTKEEPILTPINAEVVLAINQDEFRGFSCVNPAFKSAAAAPCQA